MTQSRPDGPFEIPVERLAAGRGQRRRALVAALSIAIVVGGAIGLARLAGNDTGPAASAHPAIAAASASAATGSGAPESPSARSNAPRIEKLLDVPNRPLDGAPHVILVEQDGLDLTLREWTPGAEPTTVRTVPGATAANDPAVFPVLDPAGDRILLLSTGGDQVGSAATSGRARLLDRHGRVLWSGDDLAPQSGAIWSDDGRTVVTVGGARRWHVVTIDDTGRARDRSVALPFRIFLPTPLPTTDLAVPRVDPRTLPLGFSADGRWAYGGVVSAELGILIGEFRVAIDGTRVEPVPDLRVGQADGLVPRPGTLGGRLVDPVSGRIANSRVNADTVGGAPTLEVRNPDNGFAFTVDARAPLGSWWGSDGGLYVLSADSSLFPEQAALVRVGPDGFAGPPIVATGPITGAGFLGVDDGYGALVISVTRPSSDAQIVLVDLADPTRISALGLPVYATASIIAAELRP